MAFLNMKNNSEKIWGPPIEKNPQIGAVILFQQMQLCCTCDVPDDLSKIKKKIGIKNYPSSVIALKLVLLRHNL